METVLKYTEDTTGAYSEGSHQTVKDKGLDAKFKLLDEIESGFDLALGFNDLGGTGDFSSEYIVASKRVRDFDISIGLGWGRLGGVEHFSNILTLIDSDRDEIGRGGKRGGGRISLDRFFSGMNTSVFGGIEYFTPIENLSLKVEYD